MDSDDYLSSGGCYDSEIEEDQTYDDDDDFGFESQGDVLTGAMKVLAGAENGGSGQDPYLSARLIGARGPF